MQTNKSSYFTILMTMQELPDSALREPAWTDLDVVEGEVEELILEAPHDGGG